MDPAVRVVAEHVELIAPWDDEEANDRAEVLTWLAATSDVFRRQRPATPDRHLVAYFPVVDPASGRTLLVDHVNAQLWLPPGGHVEPGEDPVDTVRREADEELGMDAVFAHAPPRPLFLTIQTTVGVDHGHVDVSLWFVLVGDPDAPLVGDPGEFRAVRWWSAEEIARAGPSRFDPHYLRFLGKLAAATPARR